MNCAQACALLGDHLEGDLALPARSEIDEHLNQCTECKRELHELRSTVALLRSLPTPEPPPRLVADVMERIDSSQTRIARLPVGFRRVFDPRVAVPLAAGIAGVVMFATINPGAGNPGAGNVGATETASVASTGSMVTPGSPSLENPKATSRIADRIERRIWDERPATLPGTVVAAQRASVSNSSRFRVEPRLTSTERNLAIRLRSNSRSRGGFYGRTDPDSQYLDLDAHIDRAKTQPEVFLAEVENADAADRTTFIAPFAARAARRGDGQIVAGQLRRASHPQARTAAELFEESWRSTRSSTHTRPAQPTYSR